MIFSNVYHFQQSVDTIFQAYVNEVFITTKMKAFGARNVVINIEQEGTTYKMEVSREMPIEVPGPLKKFAKPWNKVVQREIWTGIKGGPYKGQMEMEIDGVPVEVNGQMELRSEGNGTAAEVRTEINSNIPFLGKTISKFVSQVSKETINQEFDYISKHA